MFYFLISFLSFLILSKSFTRTPFSIGFWLNLSSSSIFRIKKSSISFSCSFYKVPLTMPLKKNKISESNLDDEGERGKISLLYLPELPLESILERLSPAELCSMATVCKSMRDRCQSDYLWEKLMKKKWVNVIGDSAYQQWRCHEASRNTQIHQQNQKGLFGSLLCTKPKSQTSGQERRSLSVMALYTSLTNGKFWFPAQVYNRENGHAGFMLSCYDAQLCYDSGTDTFQARYSPHGRWAVEENITWERLRIPPIDISPHVLYTSDCLADLWPGDHVEIQWRRNREFAYGWWYGVVGHLKSCAQYGNNCLCHLSDTVILEFKQYNSGSRWRQTVINRKHHIEEGNKVDGFYGGIRKLHSKCEIARWSNLWPTKPVE